MSRGLFLMWSVGSVFSAFPFTKPNKLVYYKPLISPLSLPWFALCSVVAGFQWTLSLPMNATSVPGQRLDGEQRAFSRPLMIPAV